MEAQENRITVREALDVVLRNNLEINRVSEQIDLKKSFLRVALGLKAPTIYYYKEGINEDLFGGQSRAISQSIVFPLRGCIFLFQQVSVMSLAASFVFIPMTFNTGPGSEVQRPLESVVICGLVTVTLSRLLVLPTVYYWMERKRKVTTTDDDIPLFSSEDRDDDSVKKITFFNFLNKRYYGRCTYTFNY